MHAAQTYADFGNDSDFLAGPERTSIMAIIALVLGIISIPACILAGLGVVPGVLAILLGIVALVLIGGSGGRVGGKGIAAGGIATGFIGAILGAVVLGAGFAAYQGIKQIIDDLNQKFVAFDGGDVTAITPALAPSANISESQLATFREDYQSSIGAFSSFPTSIGELFGAYTELAKVFETNPEFQQGNSNIIPVPASFANGRALVVVSLNQAEDPPISNIRLYDSDGTLVANLADPDAVPASVEGGDAAPAAVDTDDAADADAEPSDG